jgi:DNA repair exonuclease SbcCD nuclease subunit
VPEVKVLHLADMHLDWPFTGLGGGEAKSRMRREELKAVFASIIDLAIRENVQVLLVAGDLFEHKYATRGTIQFIDEQFRRLPGARIFISPGNHDPYISGSYWETYPWAPHVHIFGPVPERIDLPQLGATVRGWGFGAWEVRESKLAGFPAPHPEHVNLVIVHGGDAAYHPFTSAELAGLGADYIALGHIHKEGPVLEQAGQVIARYSGSPEALSFGEPGEHGVYLGTVAKDAVRMQWVATGRRRYITADVDAAGAVSLEDLAAAIRRVAPPDERREHCYRLTLTGAVDPGLQVDLPLLTDKLAGEFYLLRLTDGTAPDYDLPALARERGARGLFVQRLLAMEAAAAEPAERKRIRRALALGLAALSSGKGGGL